MKLKRKIKRLWYRKRWGIKIGLNDTLESNYGKGRFVDVLKKGSFLDIVSHQSSSNVPKGMIRIIPCQYNHGVMIEFHDENGKMRWRTHCNYTKFYQIGNGVFESASVA